MLLQDSGLISRTLLAGIPFVIALSAVHADEMPRVTDDDGKTARMVAELLTKRHINHPVIDDNVSRKLLTGYIDSWDPQKLYFFQSDIDEFKQSELQLDDQIFSGNVEFASVVLDRLFRRMKEHQALIGKLIDQEHDFSVDEVIMLDRNGLNWTASGQELSERWRRQVKFDLLKLKFDGLDLTKARSRIHARHRRNVVLLPQTEVYEVMESYLTSLAKCIDPYAEYIAPETLDSFRGGMLIYHGVGIRLRDENGLIVVQNILDGGAAQRHGQLLKGDRIIGVDPDGPRKDKELIEVSELKLSEVVDLISGPRQFPVTLQVETRDGRIKSYTMERSGFNSREREAQGEIIDVSEWIEGDHGRIAVLNVPTFNRDFFAQASGKDFQSTSREVRAILERFQNQEVDALIVDLRGTESGSLMEALELAGLFIPKGSFVQVRDDDGIELYSADDAEANWDKPLVVICDRNSRLQAEVFAGAIQDYRRGIIVGDTTSGRKGTVQNVIDVHDGVSIFPTVSRGAVKLTFSTLYRINGECIESNGIPSDVVLPSILNHFNALEESLNNPWSFEANPAADCTPLRGTTKELIQQLNQMSQHRVKSNEEFQQLQARIDRWIELKKTPTASLKEDTFRKEETARREFDEALDRVSGHTSTDTEHDIFVKNAYSREVVHVMIDYLELLQVN